MTPKTKAILKTAGVVFAGALAFGYLPLVSFAVAPQIMGWTHVGLATIHPLLGEGLLATGCLAGIGLGLKKTWGKYFAEKKLEQKIDQIVAEKVKYRQKEGQEEQKENTKEKQRPERLEVKEVAQENAVTELTPEKKKALKRLGLKKNMLLLFHRRKQHRNAA